MIRPSFHHSGFSNCRAVSGTRFAEAAFQRQHPADERTRADFTDLNGAVQKEFQFGGLSIAPELYAQFSFIKNDLSGDEVEPFDDANSYRIGSWVSYSLGTFGAHGFIAYQFRDNGYSSLLPWVLGADLTFSKVKIFAQGFGFESITDDDDTDTTRALSRGSHNFQVNGGTLKYNSVNPNLISARVGGLFQLTHSLQFFADYTMDIDGESTARGQSIGIGLNWNAISKGAIGKGAGTGAANSKKAGQKSKKKKSKTKTNSPSKEDFTHTLEEDYDETLYEDDEE